MMNLFRKVLRGPFGAYLQCFVPLLIVVGAILVFMSGLGCAPPRTDPGDYEASPASGSQQKADGAPPPPQIFMPAQLPLGAPDRGMGIVVAKDRGPVTVVLQPPAGATNFRFAEQMPEPGGPPFVFHDVPAGGAFSVVMDLSSNASDWPGVTVATAQYQDGSQGYGVLETQIETDSTLSDLVIDSVPLGPQASTLVDHEMEETWLWKVERYIHPSDGVTMTAEWCQDIIDLWQQENVFGAILAPDVGASDAPSYTLPIVLQSEYSATVKLVKQAPPFTTYITVPVEVRPEQLGALVREMPPPDGQRWVALGLRSSEPYTCPNDLEIAPWEWDFVIELWLDLGGELDQPVDEDGQGVSLGLYRCFEEQVQETSGVVAVQATEIVCQGPESFYLDNAPLLELMPSLAVEISPGETLSLRHSVNNQDSDPVTVTLEVTSELGVDWGLYKKADLTEPIVGPVRLEGNGGQLFYAGGDVPVGAEDGAYTLFLTATSVLSPELSVWTSDLIRVGSWTPPEPPPCMPLDEVTIAGPARVSTGRAYSFQVDAGPLEATSPINYSWVTGEQYLVRADAGVSDGVDLTWEVTGTQVISVTAANCAGSRVATRTVTIEVGGDGRFVYLPLVVKSE